MHSFIARQRTRSALQRSNRIQTRAIQHGWTSRCHEIHHASRRYVSQSPSKWTRRSSKDWRTWKPTHWTLGRCCLATWWSCRCRASRSACASVTRHVASSRTSTTCLDWWEPVTLLSVASDHLIRQGIKQRAKVIQQKCEVLLMNIHRSASQFQLPERVRFEYIQYLSKRFDEAAESEKALEHLYDRIERMQYTFHQKLGTIIAEPGRLLVTSSISLIADSSTTITLEDLHEEIKHRYPIEHLSVPTNLSSNTETLAVTFDAALRLLHDDVNYVRQNKNEIVQEMQAFSAVSREHESSSVPIRVVQTEVKLHEQQQLLTSIDQLKVLLHKVSTTEEQSSQYGFLLKKLDRLYETFRKKHQMELPPKNDIQSIHALINDVRRKVKREAKSQQTTRQELVRKLDVIKKKEELRTKAKTASLTEVIHSLISRAWKEVEGIDALVILLGWVIVLVVDGFSRTTRRILFEWDRLIKIVFADQFYSLWIPGKPVEHHQCLHSASWSRANRYPAWILRPAHSTARRWSEQNVRDEDGWAAFTFDAGSEENLGPFGGIQAAFSCETSEQWERIRASSWWNLNRTREFAGRQFCSRTDGIFISRTKRLPPSTRATNPTTSEPKCHSWSSSTISRLRWPTSATRTSVQRPQTARWVDTVSPSWCVISPFSYECPGSIERIPAPIAMDLSSAAWLAQFNLRANSILICCSFITASTAIPNRSDSHPSQRRVELREILAPSSIECPDWNKILSVAIHGEFSRTESTTRSNKADLSAERTGRGNSDGWSSQTDSDWTGDTQQDSDDGGNRRHYNQSWSDTEANSTVTHYLSDIHSISGDQWAIAVSHSYRARDPWSSENTCTITARTTYYPSRD